MYLDGMSYLEEERDAWRPYEALLGLTDEQLDRPVPAAHGWSGRDLMVHMSTWLERWLEIARELAVNPRSPAYERLHALDWAAVGDALNASYTTAGRALPLEEVRRRFATTPGELRGYLTVVPETRWLKDSPRLESLLANTTDHYAEHAPDLQAILDAAHAPVDANGSST